MVGFGGHARRDGSLFDHHALGGGQPVPCDLLIAVICLLKGLLEVGKRVTPRHISVNFLLRLAFVVGHVHLVELLMFASKIVLRIISHLGSVSLEEP